MKISQLLDEIKKHDLVLPEFQREYVWSREQAKQLFVSLVKGYPVGGLLFWKTDDPPELKNLDKVPEKFGTIQIILDGQQRLTTLYMLLTGEIPPYYTEKDITIDPRDLYFNIGKGEFQYYQASRMKGNPLWWRVIDCFNSSKINVFEIAKQVTENEQDAFHYAQLYNDNLTKLRQVKEMELPVQVVPVKATIDEAIDIFDRVNSQGTKLTDAELALTHITAKWPRARQKLKAKIEDLSSRNFFFDLTFMTRALTVTVTHRALFEHVHKSPSDELLAGWKRLTKILDYLVTILPDRAKIHSTEDVNTTNAFIPLIAYLSLNDTHFSDDTSINQAIHWLYAALMWSRYTAQTDQRLEQDISLVIRYSSPWLALRERIVDQRGRIEVKAGDLDGRGAQHPLYRMTFILAKAHGAVDWFNGAPLGTTHGKPYHIHSHHIFPVSILYKNGFDSENHLHRKIVNEIANRAFLTSTTNQSLSNTHPEKYLPLVEEKYPGALAKQFIPEDPLLWKIDRYEDFLQARRELIARKINEYMDTLISRSEDLQEKSVAELVTLGESATLEFKSTLQWDINRNHLNKNLRFSVLKTIAAFLNSEGGILVIGIEDNGSVLGLQYDLKTVKKHSLDGFEQLLSTLICERIGAEYAPLINIHFEKIDGKDVCVVYVEKAPQPVFMTSPQGKKFYIRHSNTTRALDPEQMHHYIQLNWE